VGGRAPSLHPTLTQLNGFCTSAILSRRQNALSVSHTAHVAPHARKMQRGGGGSAPRGKCVSTQVCCEHIVNSRNSQQSEQAVTRVRRTSSLDSVVVSL
jgi:hypothetical protein